MILHLHRAKVVEEEICDSFYNDGIEPIVERLLELNESFALNVVGREQVVADEHVPREDGLKLVFLSVHDPELLEGLKPTRAGSTGASTKAHRLHSCGKLFWLFNLLTFSGTTRSGCFKEVNFISVDNSMFPFALDLEVVGDQIDLRAEWLVEPTTLQIGRAHV